MDPRLDGPLRDALIAFLQQEGLAGGQQPAPQQQPIMSYGMPGLPQIAPQAVQSGNVLPQGGPQFLGPQRPGAPRIPQMTDGLPASIGQLPMVAPQAQQSGTATPQDVAQTLGPQPGDPRNRTREQLYADTTRGLNAMAASALDPLGIPSAALGMISPHAREAWRETQGQAGLAPQLAGGLISGLGAGNALMRGGRAIAGAPGQIAGGMVAGSAPAIDYAAGAPGSSMTGAIAGPVIGAAFGGQGTGASTAVMNAMRDNGGRVAAVGGLGALAGLGALTADGGDPAAAQAKKAPAKKQPPSRPGTPAPAPQTAGGGDLDPQIQALHDTNPNLRSLYSQIEQARRDLTRAESLARRFGGDNDQANEQAAAARRRVADVQSRYDSTLQQATASSLPWDQAYPNLSQNYAALQFAGPAALAYLVRGGGNAMLNAYTRPWRNAVTSAERNLGRAVSAEAGSVAERSAMGNAMLATNTANSYLNSAGTGPSAGYEWARRINEVLPIAAGATLGGEMALFPYQHNRRLPTGTQARTEADAAIGNPLSWIGTALPGAAAGALGGLTGSHIPFAPLLGRERVAPIERTQALRGLTTGEVSPQMNTLGANIRAMRPQEPARPALPPPGETPPGNGPIQIDPPPPTDGGATNAARRNYTGTLRNETRQAIAAAIESGQMVNARSVMSQMQGLTPQVRERIATAIRNLNDQLSQAGVDRQALMRRVASGQFPGLAILGPAAAAGAAVHHSLTQPRGDDGRFSTPE